MKLFELDQMIQQVCPIYGISSNGRIDFKPEATESQRALAQSIVIANLTNLIIV